LVKQSKPSFRALIALEIDVGELWDREHVVECHAIDGKQCDGLVWGEGAESLGSEKPLPLLRGRVPLRDRGGLWEEDRRLVRAPGVVGLFPDVDVAEFPATYSMVRSVERNATTLVKLPMSAVAVCSLPIAAI